jgi:UDP-N-acetylmuramoyl-tripeptide--D-alanyl-D-alanine ligase
MEAALMTLKSIQTRGKRIAVLADMLELGRHAENAHRSVGKATARAGVDYLLTYGSQAEHIHQASRVAFKTHYEQKNVLAEYLAELVATGDVVLVKGSRGMKMEDVVLFMHERLKHVA